MAKFIKGELVIDRLDRTFIYINDCFNGSDCIVYNPRTNTFNINNSSILRPAINEPFKKCVINTNDALSMLTDDYQKLESQYYPQALSQARANLHRFKSLNGLILNLTDSQLIVNSVELGTNISYDWTKLIVLSGIRIRNGESKYFTACLHDLKPNNKTIDQMVKANVLP